MSYAARIARRCLDAISGRKGAATARRGVAHRSLARKIVLYGSLSLLALLVVAGVTVKFFIAPRIIHDRIQAIAADQLAGKLSIGRVEFNFLGPVRLHGVDFTDEHGRQWLKAGTLSLRLEDLYRSPLLTGLEADGLEVTSYWHDGRALSPLKVRQESNGESPAGQSKQTYDLRNLAVRNASFTIAGNPHARHTWRELSLDASRNGGLYAVTFAKGRTAGQTIKLSGQFDPQTMHADMDLSADTGISPQETAAIISTVGGRRLAIGSHLWASMKVRGSLKDLSSLELDGRAHVEDGSVTADDNPVAWSIMVSMSAQGQSVSLGGLSGVVKRYAMRTDGIEINGPDVQLRGFSMADRSLREIVRTGDWRLRLAEGSIRSLRVESIKGSGLMVAIPLAKRPPAPGDSPGDREQQAAPEQPSQHESTQQQVRRYMGTIADMLRLDTANVSGVSIAVVGPDDKISELASLLDATLDLRRRGDVLDLRLDQPRQVPGATASITGRVGLRDLSIRVDVQADRQITQDQVVALLKFTGAPQTVWGAGRVNMSLSSQGNLADIGSLLRFGPLTPVGDVILSDWQVSRADGVIAQKSTAYAKIHPGRLDVDLPRTETFGGSVEGSFYILPGDQPGDRMDIRGRLVARDLSMPELTALLPEGKHRSGRLGGYAYFRIMESDLDSLNGRAAFLLQRGESVKVPLMPAILDAIGIPRQRAGPGDLAVSFTIRGAEATVEAGRMSSVAAAIEIMPGAKVNIRDKTVDGYVVGVPLEPLRLLIERVPVFRDFVGLSDRLVRLHVKGRWDDPPSKLVQRDVATQVGANTLDFFRQAAAEAGKLGADFIQTVVGGS